MTKMHELLINLSFLIPQATGISTYASNLLPYLQELNPTLLVGKKIADFTCYPVPENMTPDFGTRGHLARLIWTQLELPKIYRQLGAKLLFSPVTEAPLWRGCRCVVMVHDFIPLRFPNWKSPLTYYHRHYVPLVLQEAAHIVCNSHATATDIINFCQIPAAKITPIPLGYNVSHFKPLNLPVGNYFLYVGRHDPYKNLHRLIAAFAQMADTERELWLAGTPDPRYTPGLKAQAEALGVSHKVRWLDYVPKDELPVLINQALGLVFPSLWEGFGLPVLEALACGTPVIAANTSSLPEVTGDAALLVDPYKIEAISAAMQTIATDAQVRSQLRELGLIRASQFSWAETARATGQVLQQYL